MDTGRYDGTAVRARSERVTHRLVTSGICIICATSYNAWESIGISDSPMRRRVDCSEDQDTTVGRKSRSTN